MMRAIAHFDEQRMWAHERRRRRFLKVQMSR